MQELGHCNLRGLEILITRVDFDWIAMKFTGVQDNSQSHEVLKFHLNWQSITFSSEVMTEYLMQCMYQHFGHSCCKVKVSCSCFRGVLPLYARRVISQIAETLELFSPKLLMHKHHFCKDRSHFFKNPADPQGIT